MPQEILTKAFVKLRTRLHRRASAILGNAEDADDALQEAFCRLWQSTALADEAHAEHITLTTVSHVSIDMVRRRTSHPHTGLNDGIDETETPPPDIGDTLQRVDAIINDTLTERDSEILHKREMYGYEYDELAEEYGLSESNVRAIVSRARRAIRQKYKTLHPKSINP